MNPAETQAEYRPFHAYLPRLWLAALEEAYTGERHRFADLAGLGAVLAAQTGNSTGLDVGKREEEIRMNCSSRATLHLARRFAVTVVFGLALLLGGSLGVGVGIRHGVAMPPIIDVRQGMIQILAYVTHYPTCPPRMVCPPQSVAPTEEYFVIWSIYEPATREQPYGRTARRVLVVPLQR